MSAAGRATVFVHGLRLDAAIGVLASERGRRQLLTVDIELEVETGPPDEADPASVVDYRNAAGHARRLAQGGHIALVESFAERLAAACLADPRVAAVRIRAAKPEALADAAAAGVEIYRHRGARRGRSGSGTR